MKKIVLLSVMVILMCCAGMVKAQRPVGDTIFGEDSTFYYYIYNWHRYEDRNWTVMAGEADHLCQANYYVLTDSGLSMQPFDNGNPNIIGNAIYGVQMYTDRPLKIVGLAAPAYMQEPRDTAYSSWGGHPGTLPIYWLVGQQTR